MVEETGHVEKRGRKANEKWSAEGFVRSFGDCGPSDDVASPRRRAFDFFSLRLAFYLPASLAFIFPPPLLLSSRLPSPSKKI